MDEMPKDRLTDEAIEAFFLGLPDPGWERDASLATLTDDMAVAMSGPAPVADHAVLRFFWGAPAQAETARSAVSAWDVPGARVGENRPPVGAFHGRRRLVAGAALGTALALFGVGVAGATGVLPAPAQRVVARMVEVISPFELPQPQGHPGGSSGGKAGNGADSSREQAPTTGQQPGARQPGGSAPGASSNGPQTATTPDPAPPTGPGATGLDRAGQTSAGQSIPSSVPGVGPPGNQPPAKSGGAAATGLDRAAQAPAATEIPSSAPGPPGGLPAERR
jgi:hypothetical protein